MNLESYTWNDKTGVGTLTYPEGTHEVQQPGHPKHSGWNAKAVLAKRPRSEMIYDALFGVIHSVYGKTNEKKENA